jgi:hypothetical protein
VSWTEVAQDRIDAFADATGDHQWTHVDVERAEAGPLGAPIAHSRRAVRAVVALRPCAQVSHQQRWLLEPHR